MLTQFQIKVYKELLKIPAGETRTYKQIAIAIGKPKAARAVGNACNKNPFAPIIPCHRVIGSNGDLTGYAYGISLKKKLLHLESEGIANFILVKTFVIGKNSGDFFKKFAGATEVTSRIFLEKYTNFCHNPKGSRQIYLIATQKFVLLIEPLLK